jgi:hypothetical protein
VTTDAMRRCAIRFTIAVVLGGVVHVLWVTLVILGRSLGASGMARDALWLAGPIMTAAGYAEGLTIRVRGASAVRMRFSQVFVAVLIGCAVGAIVGRPLGPMFVGLGALAAGGLTALALVVRTAPRRTERPSNGRVT